MVAGFRARSARQHRAAFGDFVMARYYFRLETKEIEVTDEDGSEFCIADEAIKHAIIVASELARNNNTASDDLLWVVGEDGNMVFAVSFSDFQDEIKLLRLVRGASALIDHHGTAINKVTSMA